MPFDNTFGDEWEHILEEFSPIHIFENIAWDNLVESLNILWQKEFGPEIEEPHEKTLQNRTGFFGND